MTRNGGIWIVIVLSLSIFAASSILPDSSDADALPDLYVYHTDTGSKLKGAILDDTKLDISTVSTPDGVRYVLDSGLVLVSGSTFLEAKGDGNRTLVLTGALCEDTSKPSNKYLKESGVRISFFTTPDCSGNPAFSSDMVFGQRYTITSDLALNTPYYIEVRILNTCMFAEKPNLKNFGFTFTVESGPSVNALYFDDGMGHIVDQKLVTNGDPYVLPPDPVREGYTFLGWFIEGAEEIRINEGDRVSLSHDTTVYAHWWKGGEIHIEVITDSGDVVNIDAVPDKDKGMILNIHAEDPVGDVLIDMADIDAGSSQIDLVFNGGTGENVYFDVKRANDIIEVFDVIDGWLADKGRTPETTLDVRPGNSAIADPVALGMISSREFSLSVVSESVTLIMDHDVLGGLSVLQEDIRIRAGVADFQYLTPEQRKTIGSSVPYFITVESGEDMIHTFNGIITVKLPYREPRGDYSLAVYCVNDDGSVENMRATYADGTATFNTTHLSVFYVKTQIAPDMIVVMGNTVVVGMVITAAVFAIYIGLFDRREDEQ